MANAAMSARACTISLSSIVSTARKTPRNTFAIIQARTARLIALNAASRPANSSKRPGNGLTTMMEPRLMTLDTLRLSASDQEGL